MPVWMGGWDIGEDDEGVDVTRGNRTDPTKRE